MPHNNCVDVNPHVLHSDSPLWSCPTCCFDNPVTNYPTCEICQQTDPLISDSMDLTWKCPWCTWKNNEDNTFCESCCQTKPAFNYDESESFNKALTMFIPISTTTHQYQDQFELNLHIKFQQIISDCKEYRTHFIDDEFFPSNRSLGSDSFTTVSQWLRISDIFPSSDTDRHLSWSVILSPEPNDIEQGALGNCWLMAALSLVTERPRILGHILLTQTVNNEGIYLVRICHNGLWKTIMVDDCFPCTNQKQLVFSQAKRRQLYVPLIEKACAKLFGSYANLRSGNMLESLQLLTGAPCDYINLQPSDRRLDTDIIWAKLISACASNLLIGVSTGRTDISAEEYARFHIQSNHAFSILAAHALPGCSSCFVLVRDPHARSNYADQYVTSAVLHQLRLIDDTPRSSGAFWISWSRFLRFFASITISSYNEDHFDIRHEGQFTRSSTQYVPTYRFHVPETSLISISLVYHRHDRKTRVYHTQSFVLCDIDEESLFGGIGRYVNILKSRQGAFTYWTGSLRPGNYILIPFSISLWKQHAVNNDYTIVIHSSIPIDSTIAPEPPIILADCLISAVIKEYHISTKGKEMTYYVTPEGIESMLLVVENWSTSNHLNIDINITHSSNIQYSRCSSTTHDCIPPYHRQLVFINEWIGEHRSLNYPKYDVTYKHNMQITDAKPAVSSYLGDLHTPRLF